MIKIKHVWGTVRGYPSYKKNFYQIIKKKRFYLKYLKKKNNTEKNLKFLETVSRK